MSAPLTFGLVFIYIFKFPPNRHTWLSALSIIGKIILWNIPMNSVKLDVRVNLIKRFIIQLPPHIDYKELFFKTPAGLQNIECHGEYDPALLQQLMQS